MIQEIKLENRSDRNEIAKRLGVTPQAVSQWLRFKRNGPMAERAREMAIKQFGAKLLQEAEHKEKIKVLNAKGEVISIIE